MQMVLTKSGEAMAKEADSIKFTHISISDKEYKDLQIKYAVHMENVRQSIGRLRVEKKNGNINIKGILDTKELSEGYKPKAVAVYGTGEKGNAVYAVGAGEFEYLEPGDSIESTQVHISININADGAELTYKTEITRADEEHTNAQINNKLDKTDGGTVQGSVNFTGELKKSGTDVALQSEITNLNTSVTNINTAITGINSEVGNKLDKTAGGTVQGDITFAGNVEITGTLTKDNRDYITQDKGTWTPVLQGRGITHNNRGGTYVIMGNMVFCKGFLTAQKAGNTPEDNIYITGIPIVPKNQTNIFTIGSLTGGGLKEDNTNFTKAMRLSKDASRFEVFRGIVYWTERPMILKPGSISIEFCGWYEI